MMQNPFFSARSRLIRYLLVSIVLLLAIPPLVSVASTSDRDRARQALLDGKVQSLRVVLDRVQQDFAGEPIEIEFDDDDGQYIYEIKLLQSNGNILKLKVDARNGDVIKIEGRNIRAPGRP